MFNHQKSVDYGFSLFSLLIDFVFVGKFASARCFPDNYSLALEIQRIASINFRVSARLGRLA
ncbi:hypothetical protein [Vibrio cholerae]|uniref:hypothetical protein n=1 Tax=Vibrio cholerae TaxID=666 RepID=UPI0018F0CAE8|nr:hypothetical protein [Vibrio cholerae]ELL7125051.1 hypothetical protein [Vibrio cholerae]MBJ6907342.1 hypothetical protein [Vibrio cholerae]MCR9705552.1 hypothetical protein [Vibrio cholerae]